ncbi:MAG: ATP-binding protein [Leptolyngbyaceae cyanobacterium bins.59]|nr:ATP-binding protein [Leptolyngbyaceae cyanobacterium bins.59]
MRFYAYCIAPLIILVVSSIAIYGYKLSRKLEADSQEKGQLIGELQQAESTLKAQAIQLEDTLQKLQGQTSQLIQNEKMSSLGEVTAGIAHEINNPVNFVHGNLTHADTYMQDLIGLIHLYQEHYPNPPGTIQQEIAAIDLEFLEEDLGKLLRSMKIGTERIREIVKSLRNFSRLDEAEVKTVDIHEGIDSTLIILHHRLKASPSHPEIKVIKEYESLPHVECYPGQLNQVFMNILANAIDALEESAQPSPTITIRTDVKGCDRILIRITDNGLGIGESTLNRLFTPFFTTKPVGKGTGLGLSISHQIVTEKHRGSIRCFSTLGKGTEFVIDIPQHQPHAS